MRFRSKPQFVEAVQWDGTPEAHAAIVAMGAVFSFATEQLIAGKNGAQGLVPVPLGHWVVTDGSGDDFWPVEHDYFTAKYEPVEP